MKIRDKITAVIASARGGFITSRVTIRRFEAPGQFIYSTIEHEDGSYGGTVGWARVADEGIIWAHGWDGPAVDALAVAAAFR